MSEHKRCTRCQMTGEKWVIHTSDCHQETRRIVEEELAKVEHEPASVGEVFALAVEAAKEGGSPFGMGVFGGGNIRLAQVLLRARGLPTGEPEIETVAAASRRGEGEA